MKDFEVQINCKAKVTYSVEANSKAEAIRKVKSFRSGLQTEVVESEFIVTDVYLSTATAFLYE